LTVYVHGRREGGRLSAKKVVLLAVLYVAALDSKEMALVLPLFVLVGEAWFAHRGNADLRSGVGLGTVLTLITVAFCVGRILGEKGLSAAPSYQLRLTVGDYLASSASCIENIFYRPLESVTHWHVVAVWVMLASVTLWRRTFPLVFGFVFATIGHAPLAAIGRGGGPGLYIPLLGWAMLAAIGLAWLTSLIERRIGRWFSYGFLIVVVAWIGQFTYRNKIEQMDAVRSGQVQTWAVLESLRALDPPRLKGQKLLIVDDPFDGYEMYFIARLWFQSKTLDVTLSRKEPDGVPQARWAEFTDVLRFQPNGTVEWIR
jgi:hypothetical protein